jgi:hypothetical protein
MDTQAKIAALRERIAALRAKIEAEEKQPVVVEETKPVIVAEEQKQNNDLDELRRKLTKRN